MRFSGKMYKDGQFWLAEIPILDVITQGHTREEAVEMVADMVRTMVDKEGFQVKVFLCTGGIFEVGSVDPKPLISLLLRRKRELSGLSLSQATKRLSSLSDNAYAHYEQGVSVPSIDKLNELLHAVSPNTDFVISESIVSTN